MSDILPDGITRQTCPGCRGLGGSELTRDGVCPACRGSGRLLMDAATGQPARVVRCASCGLLSNVTDTALVHGVSVCGPCRRVQAAQQKFLNDLYAPLMGRAS